MPGRPCLGREVLRDQRRHRSHARRGSAARYVLASAPAPSRAVCRRGRAACRAEVGHRHRLLRRRPGCSHWDQAGLADMRLVDEVGVQEFSRSCIDRRPALSRSLHTAGPTASAAIFGPHDGVERRLVLLPQRRRGEQWVVRKLRHLHRLAQALPVSIVDGDDRHPAIGRLEDAARHTARFHRTAFEIGRHQADRLQVGRGLHQADVDIAATRLVASCVERGGQRLEGVEGGRHVDHDHRHAMGDAVLAAILAQLRPA